MQFKRSSFHLIFLLAVCSVIGQASGAEPNTRSLQTDWPSFRGAGAKGVAEGYRLPVSWNADADQGEIHGMLWSRSVPGLGHSSPVVSGNQVIIATAIAEAGDAPLQIGRGGRPDAADDNGVQSWVLISFDKKTGNELWRSEVYRGVPRATRHAKATHANTSVAVQGDRVVAFFGSEGLHCFDLQGKRIWSRDLGVINISKYGIGWGYASSPAIHNDRIAVICDDPGNPFVAVLRLSDGSEIWRRKRDGDCERSWGTPAIFSHQKRTQVVINGWPWIVAYDFENGKELWRIHGGGDNPVPTPFEAHGSIFITNAHGAWSPIYVVKPDAIGDITPTVQQQEETIEGQQDDSPPTGKGKEGIVWSRMKGGSYMSTPVVYGDYLYLGSSNGVLRCFEAKTGDAVYETRLGARASMIASLVAGDGKIFCASENGTVHVVAAGPEFKVLSRNHMGQPCFASPAISQGVVYFRTTGELIAVQATETGVTTPDTVP